MDEGKIYNPKGEYLEPNQVMQTANDLGIHILDFCIEQAEAEMPFGGDVYDEDDFVPVSNTSVHMSESRLILFWISLRLMTIWAMMMRIGQ